MKLLKSSVIALVAILGSYAAAGTPMTVINDSLGFQLTEYTEGSPDMTVCDATGACLKFDMVKSVDSTTALFKEVSGKCQLTVQTFEKSFATGSTKNEFMLDLMAFIVKVTVGEDNCKLTQKDPNQTRSLTGVYL